jgi:hypothetical protein
MQGVLRNHEPMYVNLEYTGAWHEVKNPENSLNRCKFGLKRCKVRRAGTLELQEPVHSRYAPPVHACRFEDFMF